jgi:hypothetical protein
MAATFEVNRKGLAQLVRGRGIHRAIEELLSNALDENVTQINITFEPTANHMEYRLAVEDDSPEGFRQLEHAYTLFAPSYKKADPSKRGRFNFGEKWVIAICKRAIIATTKGTVIFEGDERRSGRTKRERGTLFEGFITATKEEYLKTCERVRSIIPTEGVAVLFNGEELPHRTPVVSFEATLPTIIQNAEGELTRTERRTVVHLYEVKEGERPTIYELGIPVVSPDEKSGDVFHVDVRQKVPLSMNRDNVPPRFVKLLRTEVVNHTFHLLTREQAASKAITEGLADAKPEAVTVIIEKRFGEKRAIFDPSDPEANNRLASEGYTIIPAGTFDKSTWANVRESRAAVASGTLRPTPKPYSDDPNAPVRKLLDPEKKTEGMRKMEAYIQLLAEKACDVRHLTVTWVNDFNCDFVMCCGKATNGHAKLDINVAKLGYKWFDAPPATRAYVLEILLDEFGHFYESNHLCENYYRSLCVAGSKIATLMLKHPELFREFM